MKARKALMGATAASWGGGGGGDVDKDDDDRYEMLGEMMISYE